jgi:hypothetical protein
VLAAVDFDRTGDDVGGGDIVARSPVEESVIGRTGGCPISLTQVSNDFNLVS